jgi:heptosyltransferase-2
MSMPAVQRLREAMPRDGYLALLVSEKIAPLWRGHAAVDEVIALPLSGGEFWLAQKIRKQRFELAVIFPNSFHSAVIPFLAGIPQRVGYHGHWRRLLLTESFPCDPRFATRSRLSETEILALPTASPTSASRPAPEFRHQVHHYLELVGRLGASEAPCAPRIALTEDELAATRKFIPEDSRPVLAVAPSAEYGPAKRWSLQRFFHTLRAVHEKTECRIALVGARGDRRLCRQIESTLRQFKDNKEIHMLAGETTLRELCACLARARVVLTNDTGPMHLAAAVGTPVVALFGSTEPTLTGPNYPGCESRHTVIRHPVECSPCFLRECPIDFRCMKDITVEEVTEAVLKQLAA